MLTVATRQIFEISSSKETFYAHCIKVQTAASGSHNYYLGISQSNGTPYGLFTNAVGNTLRVWKRLAAVEELLATLHDRLVGFSVIPAPVAEDSVANMLIQQYRLDQPSDHPMLENERQLILAALRQTRSDDGRAHDPAES